MLAILSDLHVQHTHDDFVRYHDERGRPRQSGVRRNIKGDAIRRFFGMLDERAARHASREIHVVAAGDIFEIHRSPLWFMGDDVEVRPYPAAWDDADASRMNRRLRAKVDAILDRITGEHADVWTTLADEIKRQRTGDTADGKRRRVVMHYVPGNHDRLCNAWPGVRRRVRGLLSMDAADGRVFPNHVDFTGSGDDDYAVRVRHGHEYDPTNFAHSRKDHTALDKTWREYLHPAFGDFATIDFATRLALAFRAHHAVELRGADERGRVLRGLYNDLTEFDDVRPMSLLVDYLVQRMGAQRRRTFDYLQPALRDAAEFASDHPFFRSGARRFVPGVLLDLLPTLLKTLPAGAVERLLRMATRERPHVSPASRARLDVKTGGPVELIVGGHTHHPEQVPVPPPTEGAEAFYLDSGTWRTRIPAGVDTFGRLRAFTMVFCYSARERAAALKREDDGRHFETWTGHLAAGAFGPYDEPVEDVCEADCDLMEMRFDRIEVLDVQREPGGVELDLRFGIDDVGFQDRWDGIRRGDVLDVEVAPVRLDPGLDGELWLNGREKDVVGDDLLPWGLCRLPRADDGQFAPGAVTLVVRGVGKTHLNLHGEVVRRGG